ncbi:hypothetical protein V8F20_006766 [Naviculisporaceae sp. PSN 640]
MAKRARSGLKYMPYLIGPMCACFPLEPIQIRIGGYPLTPTERFRGELEGDILDSPSPLGAQEQGLQSHDFRDPAGARGFRERDAVLDDMNLNSCISAGSNWPSELPRHHSQVPPNAPKSTVGRYSNVIVRRSQPISGLASAGSKTVKRLPTMDESRTTFRPCRVDRVLPMLGLCCRTNAFVSSPWCLEVDDDECETFGCVVPMSRQWLTVERWEDDYDWDLLGLVGGEFSVFSIGAGVCLAQLRLEAGRAGSALGSAECSKAFWNRSRDPDVSP